MKPSLNLSVSERQETEWDLETLKQGVRTLYGQRQFHLLKESLNSLGKRRLFAQFHFSKARDFIGPFQNEPDIDKAIETIWAGIDGEGRSLEEGRTQAEAHVVACIEALHAVADTMAYVIYLALALGPRPQPGQRQIQPSDVSLKRLPDWLNFGALRDCVIAWKNSTTFEYLDALCNHGKHRSIIATAYSADIDSCRHGLRLSEFRFKDKHYPQRWVEEALVEVSHFQELIVIKAGNELNRMVALKAKSQL